MPGSSALKVGDRRRRRGRDPGDRRDRLGRPAQERQRHEHPRAQSLVRDELDAELKCRPTLVCGRAGVEEGHRRRRRGRQHRLPGRRGRAGHRRSGVQPVRHRRRRLRHHVDAHATGRHGRRPTRPSARCDAPCKRPDFVAPGSHLQGLRVPNSLHRRDHPEGLLDDRYFRGSGTSEATAITSGAVALMLQKYPKMTPDQVKAYFAANAVSLTGFNALAQGRRRDQPRRC